MLYSSGMKYSILDLPIDIRVDFYPGQLEMLWGNKKLLDTLNTEARRDRCFFFISRSG